ncbi:MAG: acyltransferase family protein [Candidatus Accumulibacter sp.]|nr:acyltransferase family protein [Accumulibacter sp.]
MILIDILKAFASQIIVLHHLAFYSPMSDTIREFAPVAFEWLSRDARIAVQVFLVAGGYLAARALAPSGYLVGASPLDALKKRYLKLVVPYAAALAFAVICAAFARLLMAHDSIPAPPTILQAIAHLLLLQGILKVDSLSAGVWYVAIDFQLFALFLGMLVVAKNAGKKNACALATLSVAAGILASLFYFNRNASFNDWSLYFFGAYGFGILAFYISQSGRKAPGLAFLALSTLLALGIDFRSRIALAGITALALCVPERWRFPENRRDVRLLRRLGEISYGVFLTHFPIILAVGAIVTHFFPGNAVANIAGIFIAWIISIGSGFALHRLISLLNSR